MSEATVLRLERLISAPPEQVFDAWTQPELVRQWWGPEGFSTPNPELDVRPGGAYRTVMQRANGERHIAAGTYRVVDRPRRLVFSWMWEAADGTRGHETEITVTFDATPGGTKLVFVHERFETEQIRDRHSHGWSSMFDRLQRHFS